jgi:hypothetical protein
MAGLLWCEWDRTELGNFGEGVFQRHSEDAALVDCTNDPVRVILSSQFLLLILFFIFGDSSSYFLIICLSISHLQREHHA